MLSERQINAMLDVYQTRMQGITDEYLRKVGRHIRDIGRMSPSDVNRLTEMRRLKANMRDIKRRIATESNLSIQEIETMFREIAAQDVEFARQYYGDAANERVKGPAGNSVYIERIIKAQLRITGQAFRNLSQTTLVSTSYRNAVDVAVQSVQGGVEDYNKAIQRALRQTAQQGLQVVYPPKRQKDGTMRSYRRRLDSAVRQNVLDGVRAVNNDILWQLGNEYGANGVEISAHELCAPDHLMYQGKQYSKEVFETIQMTLRRPFGLWNCKHTMHPVILGVSERAYSDDELDKFRSHSTEDIEVDGVVKSRYEWTQEQRRVETAIRWTRDVGTIAAAAHNRRLSRAAGQTVSEMKDYYTKISTKAQIPERKYRMRVVKK